MCLLPKQSFCRVPIKLNYEVAPTILSKQSFVAFLGKLNYQVARFQEITTIFLIVVTLKFLNDTKHALES